jgi:hypothetical protein|nr:MAG TPA: major capsid protein [Caudoviricetes sp.]
MAVDARNIYSDNAETKAKLAEIKGQIIEAVIKGTVSTKIKNTFGIGNPSAGSVTYDRLKNAVSKEYGSARKDSKGEPVRNTGRVINNIDDRQEIVEEYDNTDIKQFGIADLITRRKNSQASSLARYLDTAFFAEAVKSGTEIQSLTSAMPIEEVLEKVIQTVETVKNDWVDGVDRSQIVLTVTPAIYGKLANYLNKVKNEITGEVDVLFNGQVRIFSNHRQTKAIIAMHEGAIAQDVNVFDFDPQKVPFSNSVEASLFFTQGTKAVEPDLVFYADLA